MDALVIFAAFIALDVAALLWGADTTEGVDSGEWERRRLWSGWSAPPRARTPERMERAAEAAASADFVWIFST